MCDCVTGTKAEAAGIPTGGTEATNRPTFDSETSREVYEYVERHGTAKRNVVLDVVSASAEEFRDHLENRKSRVFFVAVLDGDVVGWTHLDLAPASAERAERARRFTAPSPGGEEQPFFRPRFSRSGSRTE